MSTFKKLLEKLNLKPARILDVGAGGFTGQTTTIHLTELYSDAAIVCVERNYVNATRLANKYPKLDVVHTLIENYEDATPFDLVVLDLASNQVEWVFEELLPNKLLDLLKQDSVVITNLRVPPRYEVPSQYEQLALVDKWENDPNNFMGWLALRRY